jgi:hypothetical protein
VVLSGAELLFMAVKISLAKMLANSDDLASEPCETRTRDTLIKRYKRYVPESKRK